MHILTRGDWLKGNSKCCSLELCNIQIKAFVRLEIFDSLNQTTRVLGVRPPAHTYGIWVLPPAVHDDEAGDISIKGCRVWHFTHWGTPPPLSVGRWQDSPCGWAESASADPPLTSKTSPRSGNTQRNAMTANPSGACSCVCLSVHSPPVAAGLCASALQLSSPKTTPTVFFFGGTVWLRPGSVQETSACARQGPALPSSCGDSQLPHRRSYCLPGLRAGNVTTGRVASAVQQVTATKKKQARS